MKHIYILLFIFTASYTSAQHSTCDDSRYAEDVFTDFTLTEAVKYGENTTINGNFQELFLDVYEPTGDTAEKRPTIVLAFGGSFIVGDRQQLSDLCAAYTRKGYVAVSIDYRLFDGSLLPFPSQETMQEVVVKAISDMRAAVRFLKEDAATINQFRIDPDFILVGGVSAGAITAAHTALMQEGDAIPEDLRALIDENGGIEGNSSDNLEFTSEVIGLVSFSGALNNASLIDANDPPIFSVHDDGDSVVPYGAGFATIQGFPIAPLEGSSELHRYADSLGVFNELVTIENSVGHVSYFENQESTTDIINQSSVFMQEVICADVLISTDDIYLAETTIYPNPAIDRITIESNDQVGQAAVYDMMGRRISSWNNENVLDIKNIDAGHYILKVNNDNNQIIAVKPIVIID